MARETYAIVESGGKQYRAEEGSTLLVDRIAAEEGAKVNLRALMFRGDGDVVLESDKLEKVKVEAVVAGHERGQKIRVFKYRPKKGYRKRQGHRSELTRLEVTEVKMLSRKPAAKKPAAKSTASKSTATRSTATKKPATKKPAARKSSTAKKES